MNPSELCGALPPPELCISQEAWQAAPWLVVSWVVSSALIALAYGAIPAILWSRFCGTKLAGILPWLAPFIAACGFGHALDIWTIWVPLYYALSASKALTAVVSVASVWGLWRVCPNREQIRSWSEIMTLVAAPTLAQVWCDTQVDAAFISSSDGGNVAVNPRFRITLGVGIEATKGFNWSKPVHPDDRERYVMAWLDFVAGRRKKFSEKIRGASPCRSVRY